MNNGWVKLHREISHTKLWANPDKLRFYLLLLFKAGHSPATVYGVNLKQGQFLGGRNSLTTELNEGHRANSKHFVSGSTVYKWLQWLKTNNFIDIESTSEYSIITVFEAIDEDEQNAKVNIKRTSSEHQVNNERTSSGHKQEVKELREVKELKNKDDVEQQSSDQLKGQVHEVVLYLNSQTAKHFKATSKDTDKLIKARLHEGYTIDDFKKVIDIKSQQWSGTSMDQFLRPGTLFTASHFESYLNEKQVTTNRSSNKRQVKETLPDWARHDQNHQTKPTQLSPEQQDELDKKLAALKQPEH